MSVSAYWQQLASQALFGAGRQPLPPPPEALVRLLGQNEGRSAEASLLNAAVLSRGYLDAGSLPDTDIRPAPAAAPAETLAYAGGAARDLLSQLIATKQWALLPEWFERAAARGLLVPAPLLPGLFELGRQHRDWRGFMLPALGQRGRWLAQHHPEANWVRDSDNPDGAAADDEGVWRHGSLEQRAAWLTRARRRDPAAARALLEAVLPQERAEARDALLAALKEGLGDDDEPFLENLLGDRSRNVRVSVAQLLAQLPASRWNQRMLARAALWLQYDAAAKTLTVTPPSECPPDLRRDGVDPQPPHRQGERAWWMQQALTFLSPELLARHLGLPKTALMTLALASDWSTPLLHGFHDAALLHRDGEVAAAILAKHSFTVSLFPLLDLARQRERLTTILAEARRDGPDTLRQREAALQSYAGEWDAELTGLLLDSVWADDHPNYHYYPIYYLLERLAPRLEPATVLAQFNALSPERRERLANLAAMLGNIADLRRRLALAFPEPLLESPR